MKISLTVFSLSLALILVYYVPSTNAVLCSEQPYCLTVNLTTLLHVCRNFFKIPCPNSCGQCASERLRLKFASAIDPNMDGRIVVEEAQTFLKVLNVSLEDALVTEIKELVIDTKAVLTDLYKIIDYDQNGIITLSEYVNGVLTFFETIGVKVKLEFKEAIAQVAEIIKISNRGEVVLPKLNELIQVVAQQLGAFPHGLVAMSRLQNMTNGHFNLERVITTQQLGYSVNAKLLSSALLTKMDRDSDGLVSQSDLVYTLLSILKGLNITISPRVEEHLKSYFDIYQSSVQSLLSKYGINDINLLEGKVLPEYDHHPFINLVIPIYDAVQHAKQYSAGDVMRYFRSASNNIPQRKLTSTSIVESAFGIADRNKDGQIDIPEFVFFTVTCLPKGIGLQDMNEALKVMKLYDELNDDKLSSREFKELFKTDLTQEMIQNASKISNLAPLSLNFN